MSKHSIPFTYGHTHTHTFREQHVEECTKFQSLTLAQELLLLSGRFSLNICGAIRLHAALSLSLSPLREAKRNRLHQKRLNEEILPWRKVAGRALCAGNVLEGPIVKKMLRTAVIRPEADELLSVFSNI